MKIVLCTKIEAQPLAGLEWKNVYLSRSQMALFGGCTVGAGWTPLSVNTTTEPPAQRRPSITMIHKLLFRFIGQFGHQEPLSQQNTKNSSSTWLSSTELIMYTRFFVISFQNSCSFPVPPLFLFTQMVESLECNCSRTRYARLTYNLRLSCSSLWRGQWTWCHWSTANLPLAQRPLCPFQSPAHYSLVRSHTPQSAPPVREPTFLSQENDITIN